MDENANVVAQIAYPLIAGIGIGMLFHAPHQVFTRVLKPWELATGTTAFFLVRFTGATVGLVSLSESPFDVPLNPIKAVAGTIFYETLSARLPSEFVSGGRALTLDYSNIKFLPPDQREQVLHAVSSSIKVGRSSRIKSEKTDTDGLLR